MYLQFFVDYFLINAYFWKYFPYFLQSILQNLAKHVLMYLIFFTLQFLARWKSTLQLIVSLSGLLNVRLNLERDAFIYLYKDISIITFFLHRRSHILKHRITKYQSIWSLSQSIRHKKIHWFRYPECQNRTIGAQSISNVKIALL